MTCSKKKNTQNLNLSILKKNIVHYHVKEESSQTMEQWNVMCHKSLQNLKP
jgi:hypothetical protein